MRLWTRIAAGITFAALSFAADITVKASGGNYTTIQNAIYAAATGDRILIDPGYDAGSMLYCGDAQNVTIQAARWNKPTGVRVTAADAPNMGLITGGFDITCNENVVLQNQVDTVADTMTFETGHALAENDPVSCRLGLPAPLVEYQTYYIKNYSGYTVNGYTTQLSLTPGGAAIDLTTVGAAGEASYYSRPRCTRVALANGWTLRGLRMYGGVDNGLQWIARVSNDNYRIEHVSIESDPASTNGAIFGLVLGGAGHVVRDNRIIGARRYSTETKGLWLAFTKNSLIENNEISAASIPLLSGGGDSFDLSVMTNVTIRGNDIYIPAGTMYKEGAGAPSGACYYARGEGAFYRDTTPNPNTCANNACYTCQSNGTWALNTGAAYRNDDFLNKATFELKEGENILVEGNYIQGQYLGADAGQSRALFLSVGVGDGFGSGYHRGWNVRFHGNWVDHAYGGLGAASGSGGGPTTFDQVPLKNIEFTNNLLTNIGAFPALSQWPDTNAAYQRCITIYSGIEGVTVENNTCRPAASGESRNGIFLSAGAWTSQKIMPAWIRNNISAYNFFQPAFALSIPPASSFDCGSGGLGTYLDLDTTKRVANNVFFGGNGTVNDFITSTPCTSTVADANQFAVDDAATGFVSATDHRLTNASPFIAAGVGNTVPGADIDIVLSGAGQAKNSIPLQTARALQATRSGNTATVRFTDGTGACTVGFYASPTDRYRRQNAITPSADSFTFLVRREVTITRAEPAYWVVSCGTDIAAGQL